MPGKILKKRGSSLTLLHEKRLATWAAGIAFVLLIMFSDLSSAASAPFYGARLTAGVLLVLIALVFRLWTTMYHAGYKNRKLLTEGPYSLCRNPMYLSNFIGGLGVSLATGLLGPILIWVTFFAIYYPLVVRREEANLREKLGPEYDQYRQSTPAFLPSPRNYREPEEYLVRTRDLSRRLGNALGPVAALLFVGLSIAGHEHNLIPVLFSLR